MNDVRPPPSAGEGATVDVPTFRVIEPTPVKSFPNSASLSSLPSSPSLHPSHRVVYRGSLSFSAADHDILLEGMWKDSALKL